MFLYQNQRYDHILTCIDLINNEAEESSPHKKNPMPMKCVECEVKRKELRLARIRIAELTKELGAVKRAYVYVAHCMHMQVCVYVRTRT